MKDLVSIVMPVFNSEKFLDEAIASCIEQTYSNIEIIAVNDGSTDNSLEILKNYEDKLKILSQENKGVSAATNAGIHVMKGKLFKIMNADDILYPNCVESLVTEYVKLNNKKTIIHGNGEIINEKGEFVKDINQPNFKSLSKFDPNIALLHHNFIIHIASLFHVETFQHCYYNESIRAAVDYEFWLNLCLKFNFIPHLIDEKISKQRVTKQGITAHALKETPNYAEETRNLVLNQLDASIRNQYQIALKEYSKKYTIEVWKRKPKELVNRFILRMFTPNQAKKISKTYRSLRKI